jgi:hypothetical protein
MRQEKETQEASEIKLKTKQLGTEFAISPNGFDCLNFACPCDTLSLF